MKFGKQLQKRQLDIPEYAACFVNYKALKKLIKQLSTTPALLPQDVQQASAQEVNRQSALQANKATFFFRLERELEKVNTFYLEKEAELKLRLKTLLDKREMMRCRIMSTTKVSSGFITLEEGFQQFNNDLGKLQQFVEINATAFSKILKKWDKSSKSRTKELYLSRAVEVQPCFNRDVIRDLSDQATTCQLELAAWAEGEKIQYGAIEPEHIIGQAISADDDTDAQILQAANTGNFNVLREWIVKLRNAPDVHDRLTRVFLSAISESSDAALQIILEVGLVDFRAKDEINERNCLHEAVICGRAFALDVAIREGVDVSSVDIYGRLPLHYACIHGRVNMAEKLIEADPQTINAMDHDRFTPLIHSIINHHLDCAQILLRHEARIEPGSENDHIPLNLSCQYGELPIAKLLLQQGARIIPDAEGLYPQHLVARSGQVPELLLVLREFGGNLDQRDKLYQWTPLFHAASEGQVGCLCTLLDCGAKVDVRDEKGLSAVYYAAWEGHLECMRLLSDRSENGRSASSLPTTGVSPQAIERDVDGIPDLSLPPPIIPLRRYGHNYLDKRTFIQITFDDTSDAIIFFHNSKYPAARLTISSKMSDLIPRNIVLPIQEDAKMVSFQIDNLDSFTVDFEIFPTFGSKVIAKTVALPDVFRAIESSTGRCCLPLFDSRLRPIGQISFGFQVLKPFHGVPLEITHFATYWKATNPVDSHNNTLVTGSSLSGEYVELLVQVTRDKVPIIYPRWTVDVNGLEVPVQRLSYEDVRRVAKLHACDSTSILQQASRYTTSHDPKAYEKLLYSFVSLEEVLTAFSPKINIDLRIVYPTAKEEQELGLGPTLNINDFADAILTNVFTHARVLKASQPGYLRSIVFSSYNSDVCTALNWKQPNYPVFLCNDLGASRAHEGDGRYCTSVKEAVRIAQGNNFMGLVCCSRLLQMVPALVESIKVAGLVLVMDTSDMSTSGGRSERTSMQLPSGVDGVLEGNGVLWFNETIDM